jgi:hypothetical protein
VERGGEEGAEVAKLPIEVQVQDQEQERNARSRGKNLKGKSRRDKKTVDRL